jgi:hypothetical protein
MLLVLLVAAPACAQTPSPERTADTQAAGDCDDPFVDAERLRFDPSGWATDFCKHSVPYAEFGSGGPGRDGIPPIDDPQHVSVEEADAWLTAEEPVIRLTHGGSDDSGGDSGSDRSGGSEGSPQARAYPLQVLIWHEIANDRLGGTPVAVTFCPLCYTAMAFRRPKIDGERLTFGTTGNLRKSDLVMWDRQTESWWQQFTGKAVVGALTGRTLTELPAAIVSWKTFRENHPQGTVLSRRTGHERPYGRNPYVGYDDAGKSPLMYQGEVEDGLPPMARIVGVKPSPETNGAGRAYALRTLRENPAVNDTLGGAPVAVWWTAGTTSAVDRARIAAGRDIGQTGAFLRTLPSPNNGDTRTLTFRPAANGRFTDEETGSRWNVLGEAVAGPLEGQSLQPLVHHDTFWFVWSAFREGAGLYQTAEAR